MPASLAPVYGSRTPVGFALCLRLRPARMRMHAEMDPGREMGE